MLFALLGLSVATAFVIPSVQEAPAVVTGNDAQYAYALDLATYTSTSTFSCFKNQGYQAVFIRGYAPTGSGVYDSNAASNIKNAYSAGIGTEVYMTPQPIGSKSAATQVDELYKGLSNNGVTVRTIWIQVTSPINWPNSPSSNQVFIGQLISRASSYYGLSVGIYTSNQDWQSITNNWSGAGNGVALWYYHVLGSGVSGESAADFSDFRSFGSFKAATVKQFGQVESVCSTTVNRDVFLSGNKASVMAKAEGPIAGGIIGF